MKRLLFFVMMMFGFAALYAQDIIVLRDATEIEAKVIEVTESQISYKRFDNLEGPVYKKNNSEVFYVKYANGTKDIFNIKLSVVRRGKKANTIRPTAKSEKKTRFNIDTLDGRPFIRRPMFDGYADIGFNIGKWMGVGAHISIGSRIFDYFYVGVQTGMVYYVNDVGKWHIGYNYNDNGIYNATSQLLIPFRFDCKVLFPASKKVFPHIDLAFGPGLIFDGKVWYAPSFLIGAGIDLGRFSISAGYEYYYRGYFPHYGFLKIGVRIGKKILKDEK